MITLSGYSLKKKISENKKAMIFRGFREEDNLPVIIKLLNKEYPAPSDVERFTKEYNIIGKFNSDGIIKARKLVRHQHTLFMILEDFDGFPIGEKDPVLFQKIGQSYRRRLEFCSPLQCRDCSEVAKKHYILSTT